MPQGLARLRRQNVGDPQRQRGRNSGLERLRAHQHQSTRPLAVVGLQPLSRQGDPPLMPFQHRHQGRIVSRPPAAGALKHPVDRHSRGAGLEQGLRQPPVGGAWPGQNADAPRPRRDGGRSRIALLKPVPLLEGGVIDRHQQHGIRRCPRPPQLEQLGIEIALPHPQPRPGPTGRQPYPKGRQTREQHQHTTAFHGASALLRTGRTRSPGTRAATGRPAGMESARLAGWSADTPPVPPGQAGAT